MSISIGGISRLNKQFSGRICTVIVRSINRNFDELRAREHFVVRVQEITLDGVWGTHPYNGMASFFPWGNLISIHEEVVLDPNNPEHARMISEYEGKTGKKILSDVSPHLAPEVPAETKLTMQSVEEPNQKEESTFVDLKQLSALAKQTKKSYEMMEATQHLH